MSIDESENQFDLGHNSTEQRILVGLSKISLALKHQSWQDAGQYGLSPTQAQILSLLQTRGQEGMRLSAVAEGLAVTPATASDAVRVLDQKGLVQKMRSPGDGRAIAITLTPQGQKLAAQTSCWSDLLLNAVEELSELEQAIFLRGLIKMIRKLQEAGQIPIAKMCVTCRFFQPNRYPTGEHPHHCNLVDAPFGDRNLHLECPDQIAAPEDLADRNWELYQEQKTVDLKRD